MKKNDRKPLKLIHDVRTRWNSTYDMLERYCQVHMEVYVVLSQLKVGVEMNFCNQIILIHGHLQ